MNDEMAAKIPYVLPLDGSPNTALEMGTPRIIVEIQVRLSHETAISPIAVLVPPFTPPLGFCCCSPSPGLFG